MTVDFCDSSAPVKCYVQEQGSAWMRTLLDPPAGHHLYVASITGVEVIAVVTRRLRRGDMVATDGAAAVAQFRHDFAQRYPYTYLSGKTGRLKWIPGMAGQNGCPSLPVVIDRRCPGAPRPWRAPR